MTEPDPAMDIAIYLNTEFDELKMVSDSATQNNLFVQNMPPDPDFAVSVIGYEGGPADETFSNPLHTRHPRVQVMVRHPDSYDAMQLAGRILRYLTQVKDQSLNGTVYGRIKNVGEAFEIGPDSSNRERAVVNFAVSFYDSV